MSVSNLRTASQSGTATVVELRKEAIERYKRLMAHIHGESCPNMFTNDEEMRAWATETRDRAQALVETSINLQIRVMKDSLAPTGKPGEVLP